MSVSNASERMPSANEACEAALADGEARGSSIARVHRDARGAVLVEFLVVLMPLMATFSFFVQFSQIAQARLMMLHATQVAARGAAVFSNKKGNTPDAPEIDENKAEVEGAFYAALGPWAKTIKGEPRIEINDTSGCGDAVYNDVTVTVTADYRCSVPFPGHLLCAGNGGAYRFKHSYSYPHQGASYTGPGGKSSCKP